MSLPLVLSLAAPSPESATRSLAEVLFDERFDLGCRIPFLLAAQPLLVPRHLDAAVSRTWVAALRDRQQAVLRQDTDLPSEAIKVGASTRPAALALVSVGAHVLDSLLSLLRPLPATHLEIYSSASWELANREVFKALSRMSLAPLPFVPLPSIETSEKNMSYSLHEASLSQYYSAPTSKDLELALRLKQSVAVLPHEQEDITALLHRYLALAAEFPFPAPLPPRFAPTKRPPSVVRNQSLPPSHAALKPPAAPHASPPSPRAALVPEAATPVSDSAVTVKELKTALPASDMLDLLMPLKGKPAREFRKAPRAPPPLAAMPQAPHPFVTRVVNDIANRNSVIVMAEELRPHAAIAALFHRYTQKHEGPLVYIGGNAGPKLMSLYASYWQRTLRAVPYSAPAPPSSSRQSSVLFATPADIAADAKSSEALKGAAVVLCMTEEPLAEDEPLVSRIASLVSVVHVLLLAPPRSSALMSALISDIQGLLFVYPSNDAADFRPNAVSYLPLPPLPSLFAIRPSLTGVPELGVDLSSPIDTLSWLLTDLAARLESTPSDSQYALLLRHHCMAVSRLHIYRLVEDAYARSGPYCAAELVSQLSALGGKLSLDNWEALQAELNVACSEVDARVRPLHSKAVLLRRQLDRSGSTVVIVHDKFCASALQHCMNADGTVLALATNEQEMAAAAQQGQHVVLAHEDCAPTLPWALFTQVIEYDPLPTGAMFAVERISVLRTVFTVTAGYEACDKWIADVQTASKQRTAMITSDVFTRLPSTDIWPLAEELPSLAVHPTAGELDLSGIPFVFFAGMHLLQPALRSVLFALEELRPIETLERNMPEDILFDQSTSMLISTSWNDEERMRVQDAARRTDKCWLLLAAPTPDNSTMPHLDAAIDAALEVGFSGAYPSVIPRIITRPEDGAHFILTRAKESHSQILHSAPSTHEALLSQLPFFTPLSAQLALSEYSLLDILASRESISDLFPWVPMPTANPSAPVTPPVNIYSITPPSVPPPPPLIPSVPQPRRSAAKSPACTVTPAVPLPAFPTTASAALNKVLQRTKALATSPSIALGRDPRKYRTKLGFERSSAQDGQTRLVWKKRQRVPQQRAEE